jgi:hypothetical protein
LLSFAYVYFLESGLFNGLRPIQIKKFPGSGLRLYAARPSSLCANVPRLCLPFLRPRTRAAAASLDGRVSHRWHYSVGFCFAQENVDKFAVSLVRQSAQGARRSNLRPGNARSRVPEVQPLASPKGNVVATDAMPRIDVKWSLFESASRQRMSATNSTHNVPSLTLAALDELIGFHGSDPPVTAHQQTRLESQSNNAEAGVSSER